MKKETEIFEQIFFANPQESDLTLLYSGQRQRAKNHRYTHITRNLIICYVENGHTTYYVNGRAFPLTAGMLYVVLPGADSYYDASDCDWSIRWVGVSGYECSRLLNELGLSVVCPILTLTNGSEVCDILKKILVLSQDSGYAITTQIKIQLYSLIAALLKNSRNPDGNSTDYVEDVNRLIYYNYSEQISVSEMARVLCVDRSYLSRLYKEKTGISIKRSLRLQQLSVAQSMLQRGDTVTQVAFQCGFSDPLYFSKVYKKEFGIPPSMESLKNKPD